MFLIFPNNLGVYLVIFYWQMTLCTASNSGRTSDLYSIVSAWELPRVRKWAWSRQPEFVLSLKSLQCALWNCHHSWEWRRGPLLGLEWQCGICCELIRTDVYTCQCFKWDFQISNRQKSYCSIVLTSKELQNLLVIDWHYPMTTLLLAREYHLRRRWQTIIVHICLCPRCV